MCSQERPPRFRSAASRAVSWLGSDLTARWPPRLDRGWSLEWAVLLHPCANPRGEPPAIRSELSAIGERDPPLGTIANNQMVVEPEIQQLRALRKLAGQPKVFGGRCRIA